MNEITLSFSEMFSAALCGVMRRITSIKEGYANKKHAEKNDWAIDIEGAIAELAMAKLLGSYWEPTNRSFKAPDLGEIHIRSTCHPSGHLIIRPNDPEEKYTLVITNGQKCRICGFIE